jgi:hypothetical protein
MKVRRPINAYSPSDSSTSLEIFDDIACGREQQPSIDSSAVQAALEALKKHSEPEAGFMLMGRNMLPAYNMQAAADAEHALIVANTVTLDRQTVAAYNRWLKLRKTCLVSTSFKSWPTPVTPMESRRLLRGGGHAAICSRDAHSQ